MSQSVKSELSTRERILEAAISIIASEGESAIRVDRVVEIAGFTKPVMYHHFADREALIAAAQAERFRRTIEVGLEEAIEEASKVGSAQEYADVTSAWMKTLLGPDGAERRKFRIEVLGSAATRPELLANVVRSNRIPAARFGDHLRIAESRGWLRPGLNVHDLAQWWIGLVLSRHLFEIDPDEFSLTNWDAITESVLRFMVITD